MDRCKSMSYIEFVTSDQTQKDPLPDLARTNGFSKLDLEENRRGRISGTQFTGLFLQALGPLRYSGMALLGWLLFCFVINTVVPGIVLLIISILTAKFLTVIFFGITLLCIASVVVSFFKSGHRMMLLFQDLMAGKADCLEGRVSVSRKEEKGLGMDRLHGEKLMKCWYVIKDEYFEVSESAAEALPEGQFRLYFTPKSKLLLSIEPVEQLKRQPSAATCEVGEEAS